MFSLGSSHTYYLYSQPTDMRKSFDGSPRDSLSGLVRSHMNADPFNGHVYIFINKRRDRIKLLHWESGGFTLYYKRLEKGTLEMPDVDGKTRQITWPELMMVIEGISLKNIRKRIRFSLEKPPKNR